MEHKNYFEMHPVCQHVAIDWTCRKSVRRTASQDNAVKFWTEFNAVYPCKQVEAWLVAVDSGRGDWYRNVSLTSVAIAPYCKTGRIGFSEEKYAAGKKFVADLLNKYNLTVSMQW